MTKVPAPKPNGQSDVICPRCKALIPEEDWKSCASCGLSAYEALQLVEDKMRGMVSVFHAMAGLFQSLNVSLVNLSGTLKQVGEIISMVDQGLSLIENPAKGEEK